MQAASSADQPQIPQPHRPRKLVPRAQSPHNDGVALPSPSVTNSGGPADQPNKLESPDAAASRRRRPRKLNQPPKSLPSGAEVKDSSSQSAVQTPTAEPSLQREISSLESRVQSLEGQVSELYQRPRPSSTGSRSSRRRGRGGGKAQNAANDSANNGDPQNTPAPEANVVQTRQRPKAIRAGSDSRISYESTITVRETSATPVDEADEEEEVPRVHSPTVETRGADAQRALTLSGNYKIPLPSGISLDDVRNIQSGISSANSLARTLLESRRAASAQAQGQRARSGSVNGRHG